MATRPPTRPHDAHHLVPSSARFPAPASRRLRRRLSRFPLAGARPVQLGARLFRRRSRAGNARARRLRSSTKTAASRRYASPSWPRAPTRSPTSCAASACARGDRILLMLGNERRAVGDDARRDQARRGHDPRHDAAHRRRPARPPRARPACATWSPTPRAGGQVRGRWPARFTRIASVAGAAGWHAFDDLDRAAPGVRRPTARRTPTIRCCSTSRRAPRRSPSSCCTRHQSYPVGHLSTMYWIGLQPGDVHRNISSPGWAKHAWSCFFAPWNAGASVFIYNYGALQRRRRCWMLWCATASPRCARRRPCGAC